MVVKEVVSLREPITARKPRCYTRTFIPLPHNCNRRHADHTGRGERSLRTCPFYSGAAVGETARLSVEILTHVSDVDHSQSGALTLPIDKTQVNGGVQLMSFDYSWHGVWDIAVWAMTQLNCVVHRLSRPGVPMTL